MSAETHPTRVATAPLFRRQGWSTRKTGSPRSRGQPCGRLGSDPRVDASATRFGRTDLERCTPCSPCQSLLARQCFVDRPQPVSGTLGSSGRRERSRSDPVRARVCPQHPPGEDFREGPRVVRDAPQMNRIEFFALVVVAISDVRPRPVRRARLGQSTPVCSAGASRLHCADPRNFLGFRDALPCRVRGQSSRP